METVTTQSPADLAAVFRTLTPGTKVQVITGRYKRTVEVQQVTRAPHDDTMWYAFTTSGKVRPGSFAGGMIKFCETDNAMEYHPTLAQPVDRVTSLTVK